MGSCIAEFCSRKNKCLMQILVYFLIAVIVIISNIVLYLIGWGMQVMIDDLIPSKPLSNCGTPGCIIENWLLGVCTFAAIFLLVLLIGGIILLVRFLIKMGIKECVEARNRAMNRTDNFTSLVAPNPSLDDVDIQD